MPILIRRGGQYVRYNGKYATDIDLCDCTCDDYPPGVCCCDAMGETLYMRIKQWEATEPCGVVTSPIVEVTYDVVLSAGDTDSVINGGCGWMLPLPSTHECLHKVWGGSWIGHYCNIFGNIYTEREWYFALGCLKSNLNAPDLSFGICINGIHATLGYTECPTDILHADYSLGLPFIELEIRRIPFAQW